MGVKQALQGAARPDAVVVGAMGIVGLVGELVVLAMVGHPLDQRTLDGGGAQRGEHEAQRAAGLEAAVGKQTVKADGNAEPR